MKRSSRIARREPRTKGTTAMLPAEGTWRGPFWGMGELGGAYQLGMLEDGWQKYLQLGTGVERVAAVYAIVMLYARAVSQCEPKHRVLEPTSKGFNTSTTSPASRIFRKPNEAETWAQIILNTIAELLFRGESLWWAIRDDRGAIKYVHRIPHGSWAAQVEPESQSIFYAIGDYTNALYPAPELAIPARDVAHFRMHTPRHPLIGESPAKAAALAIGINVALNTSQLAFFSRMNRPSGVLTTDAVLTKAQMDLLRDAFDNQSKLLNAGGLPILSAGLKFQPMGVAQDDAQLIEQQKLSFADIARVYGVPAPLLPDSGGAGANNVATEAMINHWLSIGLGSVLESVQQWLTRLFDLPATECIFLDPTPLKRVDFVGRIEGLVRAVQGGIMVPNEARAIDGNGHVAGGDEAYMQQQMVPLTLLTEMHNAAIAAKKPPVAAPVEAPEPTPAPPPKSAEDDDTIDPVVAKAMTEALLISLRTPA